VSRVKPAGPGIPDPSDDCLGPPCSGIGSAVTVVQTGSIVLESKDKPTLERVRRFCGSQPVPGVHPDIIEVLSRRRGRPQSRAETRRGRRPVPRPRVRRSALSTRAVAPGDTGDSEPVGFVHIGEAEGWSRVADAGQAQTNPNETRVGEPNFRQLEPAGRVAAAPGPASGGLDRTP
jgi:hypothetical protein